MFKARSNIMVYKYITFYNKDYYYIISDVICVVVYVVIAS